MATQVVELTGDEAALFRSIDRLIQKEREHVRQLGRTGEAGGNAGVELEDAMERVDRANRKHVGKLIGDLGKIGPEGKSASDALKRHFTQEGQFGFKATDQILADLAKVDPAAAEAAEAVKAEMAEADRKSEFRQTLGSLREMGPEGAAIAKGIERDMKAAEAQAAGGMDDILNKLKEIDPTAAQSAEAVKQELAEAARYGEGEFEDTLNTLRSMGPEGRKVAGELKRELVEAGKISERSIDDVIGTLHQIDPAAAEAAQSIKTKLDDSAQAGESSFKRFGTSAIAQITSIAGAYVGVQEAIQGIIAANQKVLETNKEIFDNLKQQEDGNRRLLQIAQSREDFEQLRGRADELATDFGVDRQVAQNLVFSARSEGFESATDFIAANSQVIDVGAQAQVAGQIPTLFRQEGLSSEAAINATLAGAQESRLSFEQIGRALPSASEGASLQGASAAETTGALAALSSRFKTADTAADRIKALALRFDLDEGGEGRESLADIGLTEAVERVAAMDEETQREVLGGGQEVITAFNVYREELDRVKQFTESAQQAIEATGTDASPTAQRRAIAGTDARLQAVRAERESQIALDVAREQRRATAEGQRQTRVNEELARAENLGASQFQIAAAEMASESIEGGLAGGALRMVGVDTTGMAESAIPAISGDALNNLQRDLNQAVNAGDPTASAALLATNRLRRARAEDPNAILGADATAEFIRSTTGESLLPGDVSREQRLSLTREIAEEASNARGLGRTLAIGVPGNLGESAAAAEGSESAKQMVESLQRLVNATERNNELMEQTANNTKPRRPSPDFDRVQSNARGGGS